MPDKPLTIAKIAELAGCSSQYVQAELQRGAFPGAYKVNEDRATSAWLIPVSEFKAWMKKRGQPVRD